MGNGTIRRKPITGDGISLKQRDSEDRPSRPSDVQHAPVFSQSIIYEDHQSDGIGDHQSVESFAPELDKIQEVDDEVVPVPTIQKTESKFEVDFDALFSSSPLAQSTPRLRLEPSFEDNGSKKLRNVPAGSRSLFDHENPSNMQAGAMDTILESSRAQRTPSKKGLVKRNNSQVKDVALGTRNHQPKRRKKHPSPSKAELEDLEDAFRRYNPNDGTGDVKVERQLVTSFEGLRTASALRSKDNNTMLREATGLGLKDNDIFEKSRNSISSSISEAPRRPTSTPARTKVSMIPKAAGAPSMKRRSATIPHQRADSYSRNMDLVETSMMDTDELQWDTSYYNIGMRRT
jgi:hypothetical protein